MYYTNGAIRMELTIDELIMVIAEAAIPLETLLAVEVQPSEADPKRLSFLSPTLSEAIKASVIKMRQVVEQYNKIKAFKQNDSTIGQ